VGARLIGFAAQPPSVVWPVQSTLSTLGAAGVNAGFRLPIAPLRARSEGAMGSEGSAPVSRVEPLRFAQDPLERCGADQSSKLDRTRHATAKALVQDSRRLINVAMNKLAAQLINRSD